ncbi:MAG: 16S rRNA (adenine(1518)-N(6)/adenine(1519)-N(6))-dimethyltransferase RsmA, partial [Proteobacteria bacterium]|nr:16S rRNA (adenine(1518)-N(6)/adenine(1519)-N(6))-dimethyltransferase RsmA [Pseudomonadota bacterium]
KPQQKIIEIGPGHGALTEHLQASGANLHLVELDNDLIPELKIKYAHFENVTLHHQDALQLKFSSFHNKVVGNLPYNISSPLLINLLFQADHVDEMVFMLQKEVVQRLIAEPGSKSFGRLSVMLQHRYNCYGLMVIKPDAFYPRPKIDSQIIQLTLKPDYADIDIKKLEKLVKLSFAQRRKTIRNNLKKVMDISFLEKVGIDPGQRPETITVSQYEKLSHFI